MNYKIINDYISYGGQRYLVVRFFDIDNQNEIAVSEGDDIDGKIVSLYNSMVTTQNVIEPDVILHDEICIEIIVGGISQGTVSVTDGSVVDLS